MVIWKIIKIGQYDKYSDDKTSKIEWVNKYKYKSEYYTERPINFYWVYEEGN